MNLYTDHYKHLRTLFTFISHPPYSLIENVSPCETVLAPQLSIIRPIRPVIFGITNIRMGWGISWELSKMAASVGYY